MQCKHFKILFLCTLVVSIHLDAMEQSAQRSRKRPIAPTEQTNASTPPAIVVSDTLVDAVCSLIEKITLTSAAPPNSEQKLQQTPEPCIQKTADTKVDATVVDALCTVINAMHLTTPATAHIDSVHTTAQSRTVFDSLSDLITTLTQNDNTEQKDTPCTHPEKKVRANLHPIAKPNAEQDEDLYSSLASAMRQRLLALRAKKQSTSPAAPAADPVIKSICSLLDSIHIAHHTEQQKELERQPGAILIRTAQQGHIQKLYSLLQSGVSPDTAHQGTTALIEAASAGHTACAQMIVMTGACINRTNIDGQTALICAARNGHEETVNLLLACGAQDIPDYDGNTALFYATQQGHDAIAATLSRYWGDMMVQAMTNAWTTYLTPIY